MKAMNQETDGEGSNPSPSAIIAFLRGINVGGHKKVTMAALKAAFESMGFRNVRTVLASGNVVFESRKTGPDLAAPMARGLAKAFGFPVPVILRSTRELKAMVASDPFKAVPGGPDVRLYVTFRPKKAPALPPARLPEPPAGVRIIRIDPGEVYSVVRLSQGAGTPDLMAFLERTLGRDVTTRNWQTVIKIAER